MKAEVAESGIGDGDPLEAVLPIGYDDAIVADFYAVLRLLRDARPIYYTAIAERMGLDQKYVHLVLEVIASKDLTEYGSSPRGSWLTDRGEAILRLATEWREARQARDRQH